MLNGYCYKISVVNTIFSTQEADINLHFNQSVPEKDIPSIKIHVTSEQNSYGVIGFKWLNGKAATTQIEKGNFKIMDLKPEKYKYLSPCSQESFYECFSKILGAQLEGSKCTAISLPNLPICKTEETDLHSKNLFMALWLKVAKSEICPRLCDTMDYSGEETSGNLSTYGNNAAFGFQYSFPVTKAITVHKEYVIYDAISMIGSVGGTLGMFIGFSFTGLIPSIMKLLQNVFDFIEVK